jgi:tRNA A37 threonylcarbamoyladenosine dehydratase
VETKNRFDGVKRIYTDTSFELLNKSHVAIFGIGGVGSWACESLARSGVGEITLIDLDDICISNTNRQVHALDGNYGKLKVHAMRDRVLAINPECKVNCIEDFFSESTMNEILSENFDYVIDAIDSMKSKCILISECRKREIKIITTGGAGGKFDPGHIRIGDLSKCFNDKLLGTVRNNLKRFYKFPKHTNIKFNVPCVFSPEFRTEPEQHTTASALNCQNGYGSLTHITGTFGFMAAGYVINDLLQKQSKAELRK